MREVWSNDLASYPNLIVSSVDLIFVPLLDVGKAFRNVKRHRDILAVGVNFLQSINSGRLPMSLLIIVINHTILCFPTIPISTSIMSSNGSKDMYI